MKEMKNKAAPAAVSVPDKRAAAILLALYPHFVSREGFGLDDDVRYSYWWRFNYEYDEWDYQPARDSLSDREFDDWFYEHCIDDQGETLPDDQRPPRPPSAMNKLPSGYRWRGRRVVPVDKTGAMVRQKAQP